MKLVVCYGGGSEGSGSWEKSLCVEFESKDHFLVAFIDAFNVWAAQAKQYFCLQRNLADARASQNQKKIDLAYSKWLDHWEKFQLHGPLLIDGLEFSDFEDFEQTHGEYVIISLPEVYELEEWFERNRAPVYKQRQKL